jgi:phytoene desaturase
MNRWDVILVGAGPGGLAAALLLARAGLRVKICERLDRPGGRTSALESDGFRFDLGPTFFLYPRILEEIFAEVGRDLWAEVPMVRLDPHYRLMFGAGGALDATADARRMREEIRRLCPRDADALEGYLAENRRKLAGFRPILESACSRWTNLAHPRWLKLLPLVRPWLSLDGDLRRHFSDPRIRLAFSFQSKYLGMSPFRCPSLFSILSFLEYEHGVYHPYGGCAAVSERMAEIAAEMGVTVECGRPVEEILFQGRRAVGVRTADGVDACDALVINADFARAMHRLVPDRLRKTWSNRTLQRKQFSCSTFMMYLGLDGRYDDLPHHTIYIARDYARNLADIESRHVLSADPSVYVQNATVTDPSLAPRGQSTLYVLAPVTHQHPHVDWTVERGRFREVILSQLEQRLGLTDLRKRIRFERICTPADWDASYEVHLGATFNLAHTLSQMLHLRPQNRFADLDGVYLVGGGTHPGSGLPVIYESARITSRLLLADLGRERRPAVARPPAERVPQLTAYGEP